MSEINSEETEETVKWHYMRAFNLALAEVERRARAILREHPELDEFILGMGIWIFTAKDGNDLGWDSSLAKPVADLIGEWDEYLKLTGEPMRFTADGPVVREW